MAETWPWWLGGTARLWQQRAERPPRSYPLHKTLIAVAAAALALQGCAQQPTPAQVRAEEMSEGRATTCDASSLDVAAGGTANATISMTNDGWCAVHAAEKDGQPFQLGLVSARPAHGHLNIHPVSGRTRIQYMADERYVGPDTFTVALRSRTSGAPDTKVQVAVTVAAGPGQAAAPASAPAPTRQTPAARSSTPRRTTR